MIRKLFIVSISSLALSAVCLGGAWAIGGKELIANNGWTFDIDGKDSGPRVTRTLAFDPAVPLVLDAPVDVAFTRSDKVEMIVSGKPALIDRFTGRMASCP